MTHWQILRASKASLLAPGYPLHHGHRVAVHYSTAAEALDGSAASTDKLTMQELNSRLALYLQQVHCLEAANQQLEYQILQQLDKKCPGDLQHLDGHLQMVSLLRDQISEQLSIQGQMKLQLLTAELVACNFKIRFEKEQEYRGGVEAELKYLKLLGEELMMHKLPELQKLLNSQTQQMMQMQIQHQQNVQGLLAQVSGGITVDMQVVKSADLKLQLNHQKHNVTLFNHDDCFTNQETTATFQRPAVSEAAVVGLNQLRGTAASMEQELMLLQSQNMQLECFGQQQMESSVEQLEFLQQREDGLCRDLDSALQTVTQQAANYQDLLDIKNQLENEIQNYRHLLDEQGCQWLPKNSFCAPFNTAAFRNKIIQENMVSFQGGNLNMGAVQTKGYTGTVQQTPVFTPLSETVATVQSIRVQDNSPLTSIYTSDLTDLFHKTENQRTEALFERSERESTMINRWSNLIDYKDHTIDPESFSLKQTNIDVGFKAGTSTDNITGADIKQETHFITHTATADPCTQPLAEVVKETETAELKSYVHTFDQDSAQVASLKLEPQAEMIKDAVEVAVTTFEVSSLPTTSSCSATSNEILVSESLTASADTLRKSMTMNRWSCLLEDKVQAVDPDPLNQSVVGAQISLGVEDRSITSLKSEPQAEMIKDASEVVVTAFEVSSLPTASSCSATSNEILVSESLTASADTLRKSMTMNRWSCLLEDKVQAVEPDPLNQSVVGAQISLGVEDRSITSLKSEPQAEMIKDASEVVVTAFEVSSLPTASSCSATSNEILVSESLTASADTLRKSMTMNRWSCLLEDKVQAVEPDPLNQSVVGAQISMGVEDRSITSLKSEPQAEMIKDASEVVVTAFEVSSLPTASSCSATSNEILVSESLTASADTLRKSMTMNRWSCLLEDKVQAVEPDPLNQSVVGAQISLGVEDRSITSLKSEPQAEMIKDASEVVVTAFEVSSLPTASSCSATSNEILVSESLTASADTLRKSMTMNRWSCLLEDKVQAVEPDPLNQSVVGAQISMGVEDRSITSLKSEPQAEMIKDASEVVVTAFEVSSLPTASSCSATSNEILVSESLTASADTLRKSMTMNRWSCLLEDKVQAVEPDPLNQSVVGAQISLGVEDRSITSLKSELQAEMIKDASEVVVTAFEVSSLPTASSCSATSNEILVSESLTASADTLRKSMTMNRWSCLLEDKVQAVEPDPLNQSVVGAQISLGVEDRSITSLKSEPQAEMIKDASEVVVTAFEVSSLPTASSCSATSNEILVSESLTASADTLRKSMTMNRWSCLLEDKVQAVEPDLLNQSVVGAQISLGVEDRSVPSLKLEPQAEVVRDASEVVVVTAFEVSGSEGVQGEVSSGVMLMDGKNSVKEVADVVLDLPTASLCIANSKDILVKDDITVQSTETLKEVNGFHVTDGVKVASQTDCGVILSSGYAKEPLSITVPVTCPTETSDAEMCQSPNDCLSLIGEEDDEIALDLTEASACVRPVEKYVLSTQGESRSVSFSVDQNVLKVDRNRNAYSLVDNKAGDSFGSVPSAGTVGVATGPAATSEAQDLIRVSSKESEESPPVATFPASSQPETGRFGKSGQWMVYGGSIGRKSSQDGNVSLPNTESEDSTSVATQLAANPPGTGRFGSTGSGEWRVYGGSTGSFSSGGSTERVRVSTSSYKMSSVPGDKMSEGRLSSSGSVLRRSSSLGSTEKLSSAGSGGKLSSSSGNLISSSGIVSVTGSGHRSSMGSVGRPGRGKTTTRHRTHSPGERRSVSGGSGGWLSGSAAGGNRISSSVSAPKLSSSGSSERINSRGGGRGKGSPRLGRANIAGGRVITSSDGPVRSTGSGTGTNQERISVCKMAALTMSAAGRERSQERHRQAQRSAQQEASASPLIQRWLTSAVDVPMADPDGLDDII
ncbi:hypothetical protein PAMA_009971 [Pampus argenteus]